MSATANPQESLRQLRTDLQRSPQLLDEWATHPADVFVRYGLANSPEDVDVTVASSSRPEEAEVRGKKHKCGCGCVMAVEFEYEQG